MTNEELIKSIKESNLSENVKKELIEKLSEKESMQILCLHCDE